MKTAKKAILLVLCAALLMTASVMGTLAYLQMSTKTVTNTFTAGKVAITLTELKMNADGLTVGSERVDVTNVDGTNNYKLIPGHTYTKDPLVTVVAESEACYVFVKVVNGIENIEILEADGDTIKEQMQTHGWVALDGVASVYYKTVSESEAKAGISLPVFDTFTIASNVTGAMLETYKNNTITITAYAVQAEGFDDISGNGTAADEAWAASDFGTVNP